MDRLARLSKLHAKYALSCDESAMYRREMFPVSAEGMWVTFEGDTTPYLDLVLGFSSLNLGHGHPVVLRAAAEGIGKISQIHSFHTEGQLELSRILVEQLHVQHGYRVYFDVGGGSVVSAAMRVARAATGRSKVVSLDGAFHGTGFGPASVSDPQLLKRSQYGGSRLDADVVRIPFPSQETQTLDEFQRSLCRSEAQCEIAAVILEPIQGAAGFRIPSDSLLQEVSNYARDVGALLIIDEIQVGLGRAGKFFAHQYWSIEPDIVLLSKSLAGGVYPLSAFICREELLEDVPKTGTAFQSTFNNNPLGTHIAWRTTDYLIEADLCQNAAEQGEELLSELRPLSCRPFISGLRGVGLAIAFDIVDPASGKSAADIASDFVEFALDQRILLYRCGPHHNTIKVAPPITIAKEDRIVIAAQLNRLAAQFEETLAKDLSEI